MLAVPSELAQRYEARLAQQNVMAGQRPHYHQWLRYCLDFCDKYSVAPTDRQSLPAFQEKLRVKHQPEPRCQRPSKKRYTAPGFPMRTIQELLGHSDVRTTIIYTHTVRSMTLKEAKSPLDF